MRKIIFLLVAIPFYAIAQKEKTVAKPNNLKVESTVGVYFQHKIPNWDNLIAQAKKENKYVFVDCYTSWCVPCKYVSSTIFPMKNVGDFFNKNFINVSIQFDETKNDNEDVIATRSVAKQINNKHKINVYPTFFIFDNTGKLVHKFVGTRDAERMITSAKAGLNKEDQFYTLIENFRNGSRDRNFITKLCMSTAAAGEDDEEYLVAFIEAQTNLFTKENAELLLKKAEKTDRISFKNLYENKENWLKIVDKEIFEATVANAISNEMLNEIFREKKTLVDWADISDNYAAKYPSYGKEQVSKVKVFYYLETENWKDFGNELRILLKTNTNAIPQKDAQNNVAWAVFENIDDKDLLEAALVLSRKSIENNENISYLDTYANLLYKLGQTKEAIRVETKAKSKATNAAEKKSYQETLDKMGKGEKTWK